MHAQDSLDLSPENSTVAVGAGQTRQQAKKTTSSQARQASAEAAAWLSCNIHDLSANVLPSMKSNTIKEAGVRLHTPDKTPILLACKTRQWEVCCISYIIYKAAAYTAWDSVRRQCHACRLHDSFVTIFSFIRTARSHRCLQCSFLSAPVLLSGELRCGDQGSCLCCCCCCCCWWLWLLSGNPGVKWKTWGSEIGSQKASGPPPKASCCCCIVCARPFLIPPI